MKDWEAAIYKWVGFQDAGAITACPNVVSDNIRWGTMISPVTWENQVTLHVFYKHLQIVV